MGWLDDRVDTHGRLGGLASVAGLLWMAKAADHGTDRSVDCCVSAARASGLSDGLRHPRADPVPVRALVRPRLGVRGNHELWPGGILRLGGIWRCADRTGSRHHFDLLRVASRRLDRICLCSSARRLSVAGTSSRERYFRFIGHADRLVCCRSSGAGMVLSGWTERDPVDLVHDAGELRIHRRTGVLLSCVGIPDSRLSVVPLPDALAIWSGARRIAGKRATHLLLWL